MDAQVNIIYSFDVASFCIFDTKFNKAIPMTIEYLDRIYASNYAVSVSYLFNAFF